MDLFSIHLRRIYTNLILTNNNNSPADDKGGQGTDGHVNGQVFGRHGLAGSPAKATAVSSFFVAHTLLTLSPPTTTKSLSLSMGSFINGGGGE